MTYRKATLRSMSPVARKLARLIGEIGSIERQLKNIIPEIQSLELDSRALANSKQPLPQEPDNEPDIPSFETTGTYT